VDAIDLLLHEHELIRRVLDVFERYLVRVDSGIEQGRHELVLLVTFFREYVDLSHHEKEESILIPALVRAGMSWDSGPIEAVRADHNLERYLMQALRHASLQAKTWSLHDRKHLVDVARSFLEFLRNHMTKEEELLFPAMRERLAAEALDDLTDRLRRFEEAREASGDAEITRRLAEELLERFAVTPAESGA
jgi:hemerythrin-like domain-containing protein